MKSTLSNNVRDKEKRGEGSLVLVDEQPDGGFKVACALLQVTYGCDPKKMVASINPQMWFTTPTKTMKTYRVYEGNEDSFIKFFNDKRGT